MKNDPENSEEKILEGEVVGKILEKKPTDHSDSDSRQPRLDFDFFAIPVFAKLKRNCLLAAASFVMLTIAAIYFGNGWLFLLALLLPPWIFSRK
ncbi:MAG: hypothetical protein ABIE14_03990 [Patescibacteria group bacterium]